MDAVFAISSSFSGLNDLPVFVLTTSADRPSRGSEGAGPTSVVKRMMQETLLQIALEIVTDGFLKPKQGPADA